MATLESFLTSVRDALSYFCHISKTLAAPILQQFGHDSEPLTVDKDEVERLKSRLEKIRDLLKQADKLSFSDLSVKLWLGDLRDLELSLEDVIEEIEFEMLRGTTLEEFSAELMSSTYGKRKHEINLLYFPSRPYLGRKIQRIWDKYQEIAFDRKVFRLREGDGEKRPCRSPLKESSSLCTGPFRGRESDMEQVTKMIISDNDGKGCNYSIISIFGMAGVGKTTFAQHLYCNEKVTDRFDLKIWVWVSQIFDVEQITRKIVEDISSYTVCATGLSKLQNILKQKLREKRFLLVLDDVWIEDEDSWKSLKDPLHFGAEGSKIVVTTRSKVVAKMMCPKPYRLSCLSDDDCWLVCQELISCNHDKMKDSGLLEIGMKIISRCGGLPLAVNAVGAVLCRSLDPNHWHDVSENFLWIQQEFLNQILPAIKISYDYLPLNLKRCFSYCSLFLKGHVFYKHKLVKLWVALGFVECNGACSLEYTGCKYFDELVERCFFQCSPFHKIREERYIMHDLYHDLAEHVSNKECSRVEDYKLSRIHEKTRHLALVPRECHSDSEIKFDSFNGQDLRSFLFLGRIEHKPDEIPFCMNVSVDLFEMLECLRVLDLSNMDIKELPDSICYLIHLRYLGLENTGIKWLPETISGLFNLQSINMKHCSNLTELPRGIKLLTNLRNLELPVYSNLWMPSGFDQLTSLQRLPLFVVGGGPTGSQIQELGRMINLRGELLVSGLNNVLDPKYAMEAKLINKEKLEKLTLQWGMCKKQFHHFAGEVLQCLQPNPFLKELVIDGFNGEKFPTWLGNDYLSKLTTLELKHCGYSDKLPSLGRLPALKHLCIESMPRLQRLGREFCGYFGGSSEFSKGFPALETLKFRKVDNWEEWVGVEEADCPNLQILSIEKCSKLRVLPMFDSRVDKQIMHCELLCL